MQAAEMRKQTRTHTSTVWLNEYGTQRNIFITVPGRCCDDAPDGILPLLQVFPDRGWPWLPAPALPSLDMHLLTLPVDGQICLWPEVLAHPRGGDHEDLPSAGPWSSWCKLLWHHLDQIQNAVPTRPSIPADFYDLATHWNAAKIRKDCEGGSSLHARHESSGLYFGCKIQ